MPANSDAARQCAGLSSKDAYMEQRQAEAEDWRYARELDAAELAREEVACR